MQDELEYGSRVKPKRREVILKTKTWGIPFHFLSNPGIDAENRLPQRLDPLLVWVLQVGEIRVH
jgi:hypothetical protein